jgi:DNA repair protein SbcC/Rad50
VKSEIERRIGLSFEQFTRAVLLAQNEFFAFLKADDGERGELLETLTGTAIYTGISRRAYERAKLEQAALQRLNERLSDQKPLSPETRTQLDQDSTQAVGALAALERRKHALDEHLRWHQTWNAISRSEQQAQAELNRRDADHQLAADRRAYFARVESVQAARPLVSECDRFAAELAQGRLAITACASDLSTANLAREEADAAGAIAAKALHEAEQLQAEAAPALDSAKALDAQIDALTPGHARAVQLLEESRATEPRARGLVEQNRKQREDALLRQQAADDWLALHTHLQALCENWPRWDTLLSQSAALAREQGRCDESLLAARQEQTRHQGLEAEALAKLAAADQALCEAEKKRSLATASLFSFDLQQLQSRRKAAELRREQLAQAEQLRRKLDDDLAQSAELDTQCSRLQQSISQAQATLQEVRKQLPEANVALSQAERSLKSAETACAENVETLRAALEDDTPCPVCGSREHPYAAGNPKLHAMLSALQDEVARCRATAQNFLQQQAVHEALATSSRAQLDSLEPHMRTLALAIDTATKAWTMHPVAQALGDLDTEQQVVWFQHHRQAAQEQLDAIDKETLAAREATLARDTAQQECDTVAARFAALKDAAGATKAALVKASAECASFEARRADIAGRLHAMLDELDPVVEARDWKTDWHNDPDGFHAQCKAQYEQWRLQVKAREECRLALITLDTEGKAQDQALLKAQEDLKRATEVFTDSSEKLKQMRSARGALFDGKPVAEVQAAFHYRIEQAKTDLAAKTQVVQRCAHAQSRHAEALDLAKRRAEEQGRLAEAAAIALNTWIERFFNSSDSDQLRLLLAHPIEWIGAERQQLQEIESALQNARTVLLERQMQRQVHEQKRPTPESSEAVSEALDLLATELQDAHTRSAGLQLAIAQDDARRVRSAAMMDEIERQEAVSRKWGQLSELIGSADGKKFRNYAQQFTLDVLLGYANRHLSELARRYRLERVKDTLALMVIDQDMGDETRSVHSLSGGESFLVSLALALGLASLSSNRVRVESLFIDEGFGSLDADTLTVAMDALDGLQSLGRKVGVISHVYEMTERIATKILVQRSAGGKSQLSIV